MRKYIKFNFLLLFITHICISQNIDVNQLLIDGEKAYSKSDFFSAKEIYTKITVENPLNRDGWFNLATSELQLNENDKACEHFYQAYLLNDAEAVKVIQQYCPNFRNGSIMFINEVEEKPKFIYGKKEFLFVVNNNLNPKYVSLLRTRLKWSNIMSKYKGSVSVQFQIDKFNSLNVRVLRVSGNQKEAEIIKKEMLSILKDLVVYVSAKHKGKNVDLWDKWFQTFDFFMLSSK